MFSKPPTYESAVTYAFKPAAGNYRLYLRYKEEDVDFEWDPLSLLIPNERTVFSTRAPPFEAFVRPSSEPIEHVINRKFEQKAFSIVIEGESEEQLEARSRIYTSVDHWNSFSYIEELAFHHQYHSRTIKQAIKNNQKKLELLVLGVWSVKVTHFRVHNFFGPSKGGTKYTLFVKFKKYFMEIRSDEHCEWYATHSRPTSATILEGPEILEFHQEVYYTGPTLEFQISGDDLGALQQIRDNYMDIKLPNEKCGTSDHLIKIHTSCVETVKRSPDVCEVLINLGEWDSRISQCCDYA